jgi:hypothetical protein
MAGTLTKTTTTERDHITLSNLRITGHRSISKSTDDINVAQPEPAVLKSNAEGDDASVGADAFQADRARSGSPTFEDRHTSKVKRRGHVQFAVLCFCLFLAGYNDGRFSFEFWYLSCLTFRLGTTGPLLPAIQRHYHVRMHYSAKDL